MKTVLLAAALCLALSACRGWKAAGAPAPPSPRQGTAAVQATIADPGR
ncbi:MAG: hypothetical protein ACE5H5_00090 [Nitrospinota bacterium]